MKKNVQLFEEFTNARGSSSSMKRPFDMAAMKAYRAKYSDRYAQIDKVNSRSEKLRDKTSKVFNKLISENKEYKKELLTLKSNIRFPYLALSRKGVASDNFSKFVGIRNNSLGLIAEYLLYPDLILSEAQSIKEN